MDSGGPSFCHASASIRHGWPWNSEFIKPHSFFDPTNRPFDSFSWANFKAERSSVHDLFRPRKFDSELEAMRRESGRRT